MEALAATMAFCEAPFEGTVAPPVPSVGRGASTFVHRKRSGSASTVKTVSALAATMAFCEAPFEGTLLAPPPVQSATWRRASTFDDHGNRAAGGSAVNKMVSALATTMAFCEAPFEGTMAPPVPGTSTSNSEKRAAGAVKTTPSWSLAKAKRWQKRGVVDVVPAVMEMVFMQ